MFDLILTLLHVSLFAGIVLISLVILKRSKQEKKRRPSTSHKSGLWLLVFLIPFGSAYAQRPNLSSGREIWRGTLENQSMRIVQIPRTPMVFTPIRFCMEILGENEKSGWASIKTIEIRPITGSLQERVFQPKKLELLEWNNQLAEVRETFEMGGPYHFILTSRNDSNPVRIEIPISIESYQHLPFGYEIMLFTGGCLVVGAILLFLWIYLRNKGVDQIKFQREVPASTHEN